LVRLWLAAKCIEKFDLSLQVAPLELSRQMAPVYYKPEAPNGANGLLKD
jgi:hypothetical protein